MLTRVRSAMPASERSECNEPNTRLGWRIDQKDQKSNQNKPKLKPACADSESLHPTVTLLTDAAELLEMRGVYAGTQAYSLFTMSRLSVIPRIRQSRGGTRSLHSQMHSAGSPVAGRFGGARRDRTDDLMLAKLALSQLSYGPDPVCTAEIAPSRRPKPPGLHITKMWWAWEDLNFRPHAYQARALTN